MAKIAVVNLLPDEVWEGIGKARQGWKQSAVVRIGISLFIVFYITAVTSTFQSVSTFVRYADQTARSIGNPRVLKMSRDPSGNVVMIDDPLKGYQWLAKNTPKDSRVFAWWDYGYQITGIGKRTSLADGNTWNHEHIATLGRLLSGSQKSSHAVLRHVADYVLIMTGGVNDDLGISTHFARIGNSVFPDHCGDEDPFCQQYTFHGGDRHQPSRMMQKSLVYNLYMHGSKGAK